MQILKLYHVNVMETAKTADLNHCEMASDWQNLVVHKKRNPNLHYVYILTWLFYNRSE